MALLSKAEKDFGPEKNLKLQPHPQRGNALPSPEQVTRHLGPDLSGSHFLKAMVVEATPVSWARPLWSLIGIWLLLGLYPVAATAESVNLAWDPNTEADLAGYIVHTGPSSRCEKKCNCEKNPPVCRKRVYSQTIDVGPVTTFTVYDLVEGETYFFAVTAYDFSDNDSGFSNEVSITISTTSNSPPNASFSFSCSGLICSFSDTSTESDGSIVAWSWDFGEGASSVQESPSHPYASAGTYLVTLTVFDDDGATDTTSQDVTVTSSSGGSITLSAIGYKVKGLHKADLSWGGPTSTNVDIYRNSSTITTSANDGFYTDNINAKGGGTYTYQLCEESTSTCSNNVTVIFD